MSSCRPSTQRPLPALPAPGRAGSSAAFSLHGSTVSAGTTHPVLKPKRTVNAHVIIKVHEVGAP